MCHQEYFGLSSKGLPSAWSYNKSPRITLVPFEFELNHHKGLHSCESPLLSTFLFFLRYTSPTSLELHMWPSLKVWHPSLWVLVAKSINWHTCVKYAPVSMGTFLTLTHNASFLRTYKALCSNILSFESWTCHQNDLHSSESPTMTLFALLQVIY